MNMKAKIETSASINAPIELVWETLMNKDAYPEWNPFVKALEGAIKKGSKIRIQLPGMTFRPIITDLLPQQKFGWKGRLLMKGIFDGYHTFELRKLDEQTTLFTHSESFSGILVGWFMKNKYDETKSGFESMNLALKNRVEGI